MGGINSETQATQIPLFLREMQDTCGVGQSNCGRGVRGESRVTNWAIDATLKPRYLSMFIACPPLTRWLRPTAPH